MRMFGATAALGLVLLSACAGGPPGGSTTPSRNENVITAEELKDATATNLYDFIRSRRPRWLERNYSAVLRSDRVTTVVVFLDNQEFGGPDQLRQLPVSSAGEIRYFSPSEAQGRFGLGYINGVIQVVSRTSR